VILKFNGKSVTDSNHLPALVGRVPVGTEVEVKVLRDQKIKTIDVVIAALPVDDKEVVAQSKPDTKFDRIGLLVKSTDNKKGVAVIEVEADSAAANTGLRPGDVILILNHQKLSSVSEYKAVIKKLKSGKSIPLLVLRQGGRLFHVLKLKD